MTRVAYDKIDLLTPLKLRAQIFRIGLKFSTDSEFRDSKDIFDRIQTVKLKIPEKIFLKVGCRTSVTFKL